MCNVNSSKRSILPAHNPAFPHRASLTEVMDKLEYKHISIPALEKISHERHPVLHFHGRSTASAFFFFFMERESEYKHISIPSFMKDFASKHHSSNLHAASYLTFFDVRVRRFEGGSFYRMPKYFSAVDTGPGGDGGGDEPEHVAARGPHGGRHRRSRSRRRPDAVVAASAAIEPTCGRLSPRFNRRGYPRQSGGDHVEFLVRHGHCRVASKTAVVRQLRA